jgi:hypothetical protein
MSVNRISAYQTEDNLIFTDEHEAVKHDRYCELVRLIKSFKGEMGPEEMAKLITNHFDIVPV